MILGTSKHSISFADSTASSEAASSDKAFKVNSTNSCEIKVDFGTPLGSSEKISNFLGIQGVPYTFNRTNPDQGGIQMWRELDLNVCDVPLFFEDIGITVSRNTQDKLELDFSGLDSYLDYITKTLGAKQVHFGISAMPKALSSNPNSEEYKLYNPAKYEEWEEIVYRAVLHVKNKRGFSGAHYQVWGEPNTYSVCYRGKPETKDNDVKILDDYVELYIHSWRAVKRADPTAKVGGPGVGTYSSEIEISFGHSWGMDDFIQKLANYNRQNPNMKVTLDDVLWQDYDWFDDGRISIGVKHIQSVLKANGFPPDTPQALMGWNTDYSENLPLPPGSKTLFQHAAYTVATIVEQLNLGDQGLNRAYMWPFDYDFQYRNSALVEIPYPEQTMGGEEGTQEAGWYGKPKKIAAITKHCKRPVYAGLQMLAAMKEGQFIKTTSDKLPKGVQVIATRDKDRVIFLATNNTKSIHEIVVYFSNLPYVTGNVTGQLKRVDETHSVDCQGLEVGTKDPVEVKDGKLTLAFDMPPYSMAQVNLKR